MSYPTSAWRALLWKDFQQVKSALLLISLGIFAFQLLTLFAWKLLPETRFENPIHVQFIYCGVTPVVAIMACVGLLIGQERQTGGWAWSSSLPQSWRHALASKACVALGASLLTLIPVAISPMVLWYLGYDANPSGSSELAWAPAIVLLVMLELGIFLSVAVLIFRDSLTGLIVGALWTAVAHITVSTVLFSMQPGRHPNESLSNFQEVRFFIFQAGILLLLGMAALMWLFRWRWSYGQSTEITLRRRRAISTWLTYPQASRAVSQRAAPRNEFLMLVVHSLRSSMFLRLAIVLSVIVWILLNDISNTNRRDVMTLFVAAVGVSLLGVTTFSDDHNTQRYRFLADRGVSTRRFVTARLLPAFVTMALAIVGGAVYVYVCSVNQWMGLVAGIYLLAVLASIYFIGALCSLCFNRVIFSLVATLLTIFGVFNLLVVAQESNFGHTDIFPEWYSMGVGCVVPLSILLGVVSIFWLARKWMIYDAPRLPSHLAWILPTLTLLPFTLPLLFGFLFLPNVPWQGVDEPQLPQKTNTHMAADSLIFERLPQTVRFSVDAFYATETSLLNKHQYGVNGPTNGAIDPTAIAVSLQDRFLDLRSQFRDPKFQEQLTGWLDDMDDNLSSLTTESSEIETTTTNIAAAPFVVQRHVLGADEIRTSAILGVLLALDNQWDLAKRMWTTNKRLQDSTETGFNLPAKLSAQRFSAMAFESLLAKLSSEQLKQLGNASEINDNLLPDTRQLTAQIRLAIRIAASQLRSESLQVPTVVKFVPTLRWRQERSLAIELQTVLTAIDTGRIHDPLPLNRLRKAFDEWRVLSLARSSLDSRLNQLYLSADVAAYILFNVGLNKPTKLNGLVQPSMARGYSVHGTRPD